MGLGFRLGGCGGSLVDGIGGSFASSWGRIGASNVFWFTLLPTDM